MSDWYDLSKCIRGIVISASVGLCVCLSASISPELHVRSSLSDSVKVAQLNRAQSTKSPVWHGRNSNRVSSYRSSFIKPIQRRHSAPTTDGHMMTDGCRALATLRASGVNAQRARRATTPHSQQLTKLHVRVSAATARLSASGGKAPTPRGAGPNVKC